MNKIIQYYDKLKINHVNSRESSAILQIIISCFIISVIVAMVRHLSKDFHIFFIVMMRNFFGLIFLLPQLIKCYRNIFKTNQLHLHIFRGANGTFSMFFWFCAISTIPLSEAVSLSFLTPIVTTIASMYILKEKISKKIILSCFISFIGVLIILRPGFNDFNRGYFFSFCSVILWSTSNLIVKTMTKTDSAQTIVVNTTFFMFLFSLPFALPYLEGVNFKEFCQFLILGVISNVSYRLITDAFTKSDLSLLQPFDFSRLIFTSIIAYIFFDEKIDIWVFLGSIVILFGLVMILKKPKKKITKRTCTKSFRTLEYKQIQRLC